MYLPTRVISTHLFWLLKLKQSLVGDKPSIQLIKAGLHGVPSLSHDSKFQHGGKVPTYEPQVLTKICIIIMKVGS
jgi:hypothetical protein